MTDLTPIFQQCVQIVAKELGQHIVSEEKPRNEKLVASDTFVGECHEVYSNLTRLATFVSEIKPLYLQVNDEHTRISRGETKELTVADKNAVDEEFKMKIQRIYEKLKYLQSYEKKRNQVVEARLKKKGFLSSVFAADDPDDESVFSATVSTHRMHILRFLSDTTSAVNKTFERMQRQRAQREKQLNLLYFQNLNDEDDDFGLSDFAQTQYQMDVTDEQPQPSVSDQLSQQQLQELESENQELLTLKTNQVKQVENLHHSMVDIINLQTELTTHLETQAEQIENLLDNQDQIEVDLRMGNRNLSKATNRNKRGSNLIVTTCIVLGMLLLFVDYIS